MDGTVARRLLAVDPGATRDELRRAYRRRSKVLHPDAGGDATAFVELRRAYELLLTYAPLTRLPPAYRRATAPCSTATWRLDEPAVHLGPRARRPRQHPSFAEVLAAALR
jgi:hypothetical protein